jgi:hypothetical protein
MAFFCNDEKIKNSTRNYRFFFLNVPIFHLMEKGEVVQMEVVLNILCEDVC